MILCVLKNLKRKFWKVKGDICHVGKEESISFKFLGFGLKSDKGKIFLSQNQYIANIQFAVLSIKSRRQNKDNTLTNTGQKGFRSHIRQSLWASSQTQPYVALKASSLASNWMNLLSRLSLMLTNRVSVLFRMHFSQDFLGPFKVKIKIFQGSNLPWKMVP